MHASSPSRRAWLAAASLAFAFVALLAAPPARADPCAGIAHCFNGGNFTANVQQVVTARQDGVTAYHTVRVTLRFRNLAREPLILAHRLGTNMLIDSNGNAYNYFNHRANRVSGIGIVQQGSADTQFTLAPGEARNATFENVIQYSPARVVLGDRYNFDLVIEQLALLGGQQVRTLRSHALSFPGLARGAPGAAAAAAPAMSATPTAPAPQGGPVAVVTAPTAPAAPAPVPSAEPAVAAAPAEPPAPAPQPPVASGDPCAAMPDRCVNAGPFVAQVTQTIASDSGGVTAYRTVRVTLSIRNVSSQPLILGYKLGTHVVVDDRGNRFGYFNHRPNRVSGIGIVQPGQADAQFRLAPGQARSATFESVHQYSSRRTVMGSAYNFDLVLVQLEPLSPTQVRTAREFALNYASLRPGGGLPLGGSGKDAAAGLQQAADLLKSLTKPR